MKNIKIIKRQGLPETNSSSSHSVAISDDGVFCKYTDKEWNLNIDSDGVLHLPIRQDFGWEYERYNDVETKLLYVFGILFYGFEYNRLSVMKKLKKYIKVILDFTGAKGIEFEWMTQYEKDLLENSENGNQSYVDCCYPKIDHQSQEIFEEILENLDTFRNFIFNPNSWLFLGNDNSDNPKSWYDVLYSHEEEPKIIASIDFGGQVGRVDFNIYEFPIDLPEIIDSILEDEENDLYSIINYIIIDSKKNITFDSNRFRAVKGDDKFYVHKHGLLLDHEIYLLFTNYVFDKKWYDYTRDYATGIVRNPLKKLPDDIFQKFVLETNLVKEGRDYFKFKIELFSLTLNQKI